MDVDPHAEAYHQAATYLQLYGVAIQHTILSRLGVPQMTELDDKWSGTDWTPRLGKRIAWAKDRLDAIEFIRTP